MDLTPYITPFLFFFFTVAGLWLIVTRRRWVLFVATSVFFILLFFVWNLNSSSDIDIFEAFFLLAFFEFFSLFVDLSLFQIGEAKGFFVKLILSSVVSYFISFFYLRILSSIGSGFQFYSISIFFVLIIVYFLFCSYFGAWLGSKLRIVLSPTNWKIYVD